MSFPALPRLLLLVWTSAGLPALAASEYLVVTRSSAGVWAAQRAESISMNGKDKVRRVSAAAGNPAAWDSKSIGRLPNVNIDALQVIRRAPDGTLLARQGAAADWFQILPDNSKSQTAEPPATLWTSAAITQKLDKKDKSSAEALNATDLYAIVITQDVAAAAASLAVDPDLHLIPGVDAAQAFSNRLAFLSIAVKEFPGTGVDRIREHVRTSMAGLLKTWNQGDGAVMLLDQCLALAAASENAFAADAPQTELRKQAREARRALDRRVAILRALDAGDQSDAFLIAYREFEPYDRSFADLSAARKKHLSASAAAHAAIAQTAERSGDYAGAIHHLRIALWRDPQLPGAASQLEHVRLEVARLSAQLSAEARRGIDPRSPTQVQLQRRLLMADQYVADNKPAEAEAAIKEADRIDKSEPRLRLLEAKLAILRGELGSALALLDLYAGLAITQQDFEEGEKLRSTVEYKIANERKAAESQLAAQSAAQQFAGALDTAASGLKLDNEDPLFLYQAGVQACVVRKCDQAAPLLRRFLDMTDSTKGRREERIAALRLLDRGLRPKEAAKSVATTLSWFSGTPLDSGVFYDPVSLAFQPKVAHVKGSKGLTVAYEWGGDGLLKSVHTRYEDKKTGTNILKLAVAGAAASQGIGSTVGWRTADRETNDFYFSYYDELPQVLRVNRENVVTKSRTIRIPIPGVGGFGMGMGGLGGLTGGFGGLGGMRGGMPGMGALGGLGGGKGLSGAMQSLAGGGGMPGGGGVGGLMQGLAGGRMSGLGGFGGLAGFGGVGGSGALRALAASRSLGAGTDPMAMLNSMGLGGMGQLVPTQSTAVHADPEGGSSVGYLTLWNSPRLDTEVAYAATGKRAAVVFSGNSFFHPFVWDAIHLFEVDYDEQGRVARAWEMDRAGSTPLEFTWEGRQLKHIIAHGPNGAGTVYSRSLQYSGDRLTGETIHFNGKASKIQYKYDKQGRLVEADCDNDLSLDERSRRIEFALEATPPAKGRK